ncbi:hypothetical protein JCM3770_006533 [Rhodotorula araucariae]
MAHNHTFKVHGDMVEEDDGHGHITEKSYTRVHAGLAAAMHNKGFSEETRAKAEQQLHELEMQHDGSGSAHDLRSKAAATGKGRSTRAHKSGDDKAHDPATHEDETHRHRIIGGYKATLKRDDRSEEAKEHARQALRALGEDV